MINQINELIVKKLNSLGLTISTCESMTGGAIGANLVLVEHASKCFKGSLTTYATEAKIKLAKVDNDLIKQYGTVSVPCARAMADGCMNVFDTDIAVSITGNASTSNPVENQQPGMAYVCIRLIDRYYDYQFISKYNTRVDIINQAVAYVLNNLYDLIKELKK